MSNKMNPIHEPQSSIMCLNCKQFGHVARVCESEFRCNRCNQIGHMARNCSVDIKTQEKHNGSATDVESVDTNVQAVR